MGLQLQVQVLPRNGPVHKRAQQKSNIVSTLLTKPGNGIEPSYNRNKSGCVSSTFNIRLSLTEAKWQLKLSQCPRASLQLLATETLPTSYILTGSYALTNCINYPCRSSVFAKYYFKILIMNCLLTETHVPQLLPCQAPMATANRPKLVTFRILFLLSAVIWKSLVACPKKKTLGSSKLLLPYFLVVLSFG